ncbi:MAG: ABC transporter substrate-binding protein [Trueperaceae bacterium]|nr:ABC transporter substrate-binding protein [Trueperaceae bacterium]
MTRTSTLALTLALAVGIAFAQPNYGGVLRAGMQTDPVGLDPHITNATATRNMLENTYDTLVMFNASLELVPGLAESWSASDDGLQWTFNLRDATFHDGSPVTADDVVFSIERIKDPATASPRSGNFAVVESIEATDARTVVMTLSEPFTPLLSFLAMSLNVIVPQHVVEEHGNLQNVVVGSGPFAFVEYLPQTRLVLERFADYWGVDADGNALPYLEGITFTFYPDPTARTTAIQTGNVDWVEYVPAADVTILQADPSVEVVGGLSANYRSLQFNVAEAPFDDVRVRQAFAYAIDARSVIELALFGTGGVLAEGTTVPAGNFYAIDESPYAERDVERARELLAEAGYADGFTFDFYITSTYDFLRDPAEVIQSNLAEIGVTANIVMEDWTIYLPTVQASDYQVTLLGSSGQTDPDAFLYTPFFSTSNNNYHNFVDERVDELLLAGRREPDPDARREIYVEVQERILELAPHVFLFHSAQYSAHRPNVEGFEHFPNTSYLGFRTTWLAN